MKYLRPRRPTIKLIGIKREAGPRQGHRWLRYSRWFRAKNPVCQRCGVRLATEVHHRRPVSEAPHLTFDEANCESLCTPCHRDIHRGDPHTPPIL